MFSSRIFSAMLSSTPPPRASLYTRTCARVCVEEKMAEKIQEYIKNYGKTYFLIILIFVCKTRRLNIISYIYIYIYTHYIHIKTCENI